MALRKLLFIISISCTTSMIYTTEKNLKVLLEDTNKIHTIHQGKKFEIVSRLKFPANAPHGFQWNATNEWRLIEYPQNSFTFIKSDQTAPDWFGGDLFQWWILHAIQTGTYNFIFKRANIQTILTIKVIKE